MARLPQVTVTTGMTPCPAGRRSTLRNHGRLRSTLLATEPRRGLEWAELLREKQRLGDTDERYPELLRVVRDTWD